MSGLPEAQGLYDPRHEHDACGVGFIVDIKNRKSHDIVRDGLEILVNLTHRGAVGADPKAGDGAGILIQIPDAFLRAEAAGRGIALPPEGSYGAGCVFLPQDPAIRKACEAHVEALVKAEGQVMLGWRDVPTDSSSLGHSVLPTVPVVRMVFIGKGEGCADRNAFERKLFVIRKQSSNRAPEGAERDFYIPSLSSRTLIYKGMLLADQVGVFYKELSDERMTSALAMVHQRFSTNTFPSWRLAHPFRMICHNGEINTLRGNLNWMNARRQTMESPVLGADLAKLWPLIPEGQSDSACFDNALELLVMGGYPLAHAMMMLVPEAWSGNPLMDEKRKAFYEYHAALMEPWDGPAAVCFTDGRQIGATLDRNGLRPARYIVTTDDKLLMASEMGVLPITEDRIKKKWRLQPGKMLLIDLEQGRIIDDAEIKAQLAGDKPYAEWLAQSQIMLEDLDIPVETVKPDPATLLDRQQAFGYTQEDVKFLMQPMAVTGQEAVGSMGTDTPIAVLSAKPKLLFNYFKQCFAQVTNPPIDSIREESVMSLVSLIGPRPNLLGLASNGGLGKRLEVRQPILTNEDLEKIRRIEGLSDSGFKAVTIDITWPASEGADGLESAVAGICRQAKAKVTEGYNIIVLSDRAVGPANVPVPSLLAVSAVHHFLIREGLRTKAGLVVETGEAREIHHMCVLAGYGAEAINPYLAFETLEDLRPNLPEPLSSKEVQKRYIKAMDKAILKVMAKMGISTYQSYCGAQIFDAIGLSSAFLNTYFAGTSSRVEGISLSGVAEEAVRRHRIAYSDAPVYRDALDVGGEYAVRLDQRDHLRHAARGALGLHGQVPRVLQAHRRPEPPAADPARPVRDQGGRQRHLHRRGGARQGDRQEVRHRRHVVRLHFLRGPLDAGRRHEPHRRQVQYRRGRRGGRAFPAPRQRRFHALGHQAGGVGPFRRHRRVSGQRRRHPDQDGPGRQARRGRPAPRPQGGQGHRPGASFHPRRRPDQPATAPRHLFDRGSGPADLRS
jgi:glutamate synthase (NADPH/NADH) large chain